MTEILMPEQDRLDGHVKACRGALDNPHSAQLIMGRLVNELYRAEDNLRMVLAPVLHGARCAATNCL